MPATAGLHIRNAVYEVKKKKQILGWKNLPEEDVPKVGRIRTTWTLSASRKQRLRNWLLLQWFTGMLKFSLYAKNIWIWMCTCACIDVHLFLIQFFIFNRSSWEPTAASISSSLTSWTPSASREARAPAAQACTTRWSTSCCPRSTAWSNSTTSWSSVGIPDGMIAGAGLSGVRNAVGGEKWLWPERLLKLRCRKKDP